VDDEQAAVLLIAARPIASWAGWSACRPLPSGLRRPDRAGRPL